jgi:hypothetical protein
MHLMQMCEHLAQIAKLKNTRGHPELDRDYLHGVDLQPVYKLHFDILRAPATQISDVTLTASPYKVERWNTVHDAYTVIKMVVAVMDGITEAAASELLRDKKDAFNSVKKQDAIWHVVPCLVFLSLQGEWLIRQYAPHGSPPDGMSLRSLTFIVCHAWEGIKNLILTRRNAYGRGGGNRLGLDRNHDDDDTEESDGPDHPPGANGNRGDRGRDRSRSPRRSPGRRRTPPKKNTKSMKKKEQTGATLAFKPPQGELEAGYVWCRINDRYPSGRGDDTHKKGLEAWSGTRSAKPILKRELQDKLKQSSDPVFGRSWRKEVTAAEIDGVCWVVTTDNKVEPSALHNAKGSRNGVPTCFCVDWVNNKCKRGGERACRYDHWKKVKTKRISWREVALSQQG